MVWILNFQVNTFVAMKSIKDKLIIVEYTINYEFTPREY